MYGWCSKTVLIKSGLWWCAYGTYIKFQCFDLSYIFQGVDFIYQLLLFPFHLFSLTLFLLLCFIVGEEVADYDTLQ